MRQHTAIPYVVALVLVVAMLTGHLSDDTTLVAMLTLLVRSPLQPDPAP